MCDKTDTIEVSPAQETNGYGKMYVPNGRQDIEDCIKILRRRADELEGLLNAIPKSISHEAQMALQYLASQVWRNS